MYLLDTNIVSETRRPKPHGGVLAWLATIPDEQLFIPSIVAGEIEIGISRLRKADPERAAALVVWLDQLFAVSNWIDPDPVAFRIWGRLSCDRAGAHALDLLIAAMALQRGATIATRNTKDFEGLGVSVVNPFEFRG
ncbi:MAG TPA: type II toxin-antitoxin system VapC family toxin [Ensifer sp.]|nr:type II toxin-antitoxin system VapC family toxin [Ensifer sp.]